MSSLKPKILYQLAVSFLYSAAPLIVFPYISRVLGPEQVGKVNFVDYAAQFFILFASFGIPFYGVREVARARTDPQRLRTLISELLLLHLFITAISLVFFGLLVFLQHEAFTERALVWLAVVGIAGSAFGLEWLIHGLEDFAFLARRSFLVKILSLVLIFVFVREGTDFIRYYGILIGTNLLLLVIDLSYARKIGFSRPQPGGARRHLRPLFLFFLTSVILSIYTFFDTVILGFISGALAVGFYTTSLKIIRLAHNLIADLGAVLLPRVSHLVEQGHQSEIERLLNKSLHYVLLITIPLGSFFYLTSREIILVLGGPEFSGSIPVLQILSILPLVIGLANIFFIQVLLPFGEERGLLTGIVLGSIVSIAANLLLCPLLAERGAAWSCVLAETVVALFLGVRSLRRVRFQVRLAQVWQPLIASILFLPIVLLFRTWSDQLILVFALQAAGCTVVYVLMQLLLFRNPVMREILVFLLGLISRRKPAA